MPWWNFRRSNRQTQPTNSQQPTTSTGRRRRRQENQPAAPPLPTTYASSSAHPTNSHGSLPKTAPPVAFDPISHHALGGGSYVFKEHYDRYLISMLALPQAPIEVNLVMQPNSSPHIGTLCNMGLTFILANRLQKLHKNKVRIMIDLSDEGQSQQQKIRGVNYQTSLAQTGAFAKNKPYYIDILNRLYAKYQVEYKLRLEKEFRAQKDMGQIIKGIIKHKEFYGKVLQPETGRLQFRAACPVQGCGLTDKAGVNNQYSGDIITFLCPKHGKHQLDILKETTRLQYNTQLLNLIMGLYYEQVNYNWIEVCGSDYAGFWQEQLLCRFIKHRPLLIVYTPLITDWSGAKVSKSEYLKGDAYKYLIDANQEYLLSYEVFQKEGKKLDVLWAEIEVWFDNPYQLFRNYSLQYIHMLFLGLKPKLGAKHVQAAKDQRDRHD